MISALQLRAHNSNYEWFTYEELWQAQVPSISPWLYGKFKPRAWNFELSRRLSTSHVDWVRGNEITLRSPSNQISLLNASINLLTITNCAQQLRLRYTQFAYGKEKRHRHHHLRRLFELSFVETNVLFSRLHHFTESGLGGMQISRKVFLCLHRKFAQWELFNVSARAKFFVFEKNFQQTARVSWYDVFCRGRPSLDSAKYFLSVVLSLENFRAKALGAGGKRKAITMLLISLVLLLLSLIECGLCRNETEKTTESYITFEKSFISDLENYIESQESVLQLLRKKLLNFKVEHSDAIENPEAYFTNELNKFLLVKRLSSDINLLSEKTFGVASRFKSKVDAYKQEKLLPTTDDLLSSALSIARLQKAQNLRTDKLAKGIFGNVKRR